MKAAVLSAIGGPLTIEDIPTPAPQAGEVLVHVTACGVCHTDLHVTLCCGSSRTASRIAEEDLDASYRLGSLARVRASKRAPLTSQETQPVHYALERSSNRR